MTETENQLYHFLIFSMTLWTLIAFGFVLYQLFRNTQHRKRLKLVFAKIDNFGIGFEQEGNPYPFPYCGRTCTQKRWNSVFGSLGTGLSGSSNLSVEELSEEELSVEEVALSRKRILEMFHPFETLRESKRKTPEKTTGVIGT